MRKIIVKPMRILRIGLTIILRIARAMRKIIVKPMRKIQIYVKI